MKSQNTPGSIGALLICAWGVLASPDTALAIQAHTHNEGIIVHQMGHLFFLVSMALLIFTINGKDLGREKGWKLLQYSAFFFILWNLDAIFAHFLDNQIVAVSVSMQDNWHMTLATENGSRLLAGVYYLLKLDHLLCVPAMILFHLGLRSILADHRAKPREEKRP
jgi:hypothetical protein